MGPGLSECMLKSLVPRINLHKRTRHPLMYPGQITIWEAKIPKEAAISGLVLVVHTHLLLCFATACNRSHSASRPLIYNQPWLKGLNAHSCFAAMTSVTKMGSAPEAIQKELLHFLQRWIFDLSNASKMHAERSKVALWAH